MPRTHVTICGAPKPSAMPRMTAMHHPHESRFAMAAPPSAITRMIATGVSQANMFVCSALAPVMNGDVCAQTICGEQHNASIAQRMRDDFRTVWREEQDSFTAKVLFPLELRGS